MVLGLLVLFLLLLLVLVSRRAIQQEVLTVCEI
jgi:hypothetical protein